jgi:hypothetical protein
MDMIGNKNEIKTAIDTPIEVQKNDNSFDRPRQKVAQTNRLKYERTGKYPQNFSRP